jgi:4-diphosphocytidyl-2-C-methyl-D-erythritol kinase
MNCFEIKARAKINLSIDVLGRREDGYHDVCMIMQSLALHDIIRIEVQKSDIELVCNSDFIPTDSSNLVWKASNLFRETCGIKDGLKITIEKKIPVSAGLAGGSTDAAAVFIALNKMFETNLSLDELCVMGITLGADIPFCIRGGTMLAEGLGEVLTPIKRLKKIPIILIKPREGISTKFVYQNFLLNNNTDRPDTKLLVEAIENEDIVTLGANMKNVLESVTLPIYPVISQIKETLLMNGALGSIMSGSGTAVFGVFGQIDVAINAYNKLEKLKEEGWELFLTETFSEE